MAKKKNSQRPLIKFSESHDLSEMILICCFGVQEIFITIIINGKNIFFKILWQTENSKKRFILKILLSPNILTIFTNIILIYYLKAS